MRYSETFTSTSPMQHQQATEATKGIANLGSQTSAAPRPAYLTNSATSTRKLYILTYDASNWHHPDTTDTITRPSGKQVYIGTSLGGGAINNQRYGILGTYLSEGRACGMGLRWVYAELKAVDSDINPPLQFQDDSECDEVTWKMSPWRDAVDGRRVYSISDTFRHIELAVSVKECEVDELDPGVEMLGREEKAVLAKCKREDTESEKEDEAIESAAQSGDIAYTPERSAMKVMTKEFADEEAESGSLGLREG